MRKQLQDTCNAAALQRQAIQHVACTAAVRTWSAPCGDNIVAIDGANGSERPHGIVQVLVLPCGNHRVKEHNVRQDVALQCRCCLSCMMLKKQHSIHTPAEAVMYALSERLILCKAPLHALCCVGSALSGAACMHAPLRMQHTVKPSQEYIIEGSAHSSILG